MWKAKPVVAGRVGGIQDQIVDGVSGVLIDDPTDLEAVAGAVDGFISDTARAAEVGAAARQRVIDEFLNVRSLLQYLALLQSLLGSESG